MHWERHKRLFAIFIFALPLWLNGCGDSNQASILNRLADNNCSTNNKNEFVYEQMQDTYLWYDTVPAIDATQYSSPQAVLEATRYAELDRFSYIISIEEFNAFFFTGEYIGLGFSVNDNGYIRFVFDDSPAQNAGMQRGDRILFVNDIAVDTIIANEQWGTIFGEREAGVDVSITLEKVENNEIVALDLSKTTIIRNTVLHRSVIEQSGQKIGYLVFNSFTELSYDELAAAFAYFNSENIDELILDLRYNGGGFLDVAKVLASLISGSDTQGELFYRLTRNDKYSAQNVDINFSTEPNALGLDRLVVLTTDESCSASESIINGLNPFLDVKVVGQSSCGKPVGMNNPQYCDFVLSHIEFKGTNAVGYGDYFSGFTPDCSVADTAQHDFGDTDEALLSEALYLLDNGSCSTSGKSKPDLEQAANTASQPWHFSVKPDTP